jgi:hypothetical protein
MPDGFDFLNGSIQASLQVGIGEKHISSVQQWILTVSWPDQRVHAQDAANDLQSEFFRPVRPDRNERPRGRTGAPNEWRHKDGNGATCANRKIPRPTVEKLVVDALLDQLLQPERVRGVLTTLKARQDERQASADRRMLDLARQAADAEERLTRLYGAIEAGTVDGTDPTLRERVAALKGARDKSIEALDSPRNQASFRSKSIPLLLSVLRG